MNNRKSDFHIQFSKRLKDSIKAIQPRKSRKEISSHLGVSAPTLSSWENGISLPPAHHLVVLAQELELSIDYLLTGRDSRQTQNPDFVPWMSFVDRKMHDQVVIAAERLAAVDRLGRRLSSQIDTVAAGIVRDYYTTGSTARTPGASLLQDDETMALEKYSLETRLLVFSLDYNIEIPGTENDSDRSLPAITSSGRFLPIVADNLKNNRSYQFIMPAAFRDWSPVVAEYRRLLRQMNVPAHVIEKRCTFSVTTIPVVSGCILYRLDRDAIERDLSDRYLLERIGSAIDDDNWFGYTPPPSQGVRADAIMDRMHLEQAQLAFDLIVSDHVATKEI